MFRRRRSRTRRALSVPRRANRQRRLSLEPLEERPLLAVMTVTALTDDTLANLAGDGQLSLREAIQAINTGANVDGIVPTSGVFGVNDEIQFNPTLFGGGPQSINLANVAGARELGLTRAMTITGPGANLLTIDAGDGTDGVFNTGDGFRIFNIDDGTATDRPAILTGLTLTGGDVAGVGGAVRSLESLAVRDSVITGNAAFGLMSGGGVYANLMTGTLEITRSTISGNTAGFSGGGLVAGISAGAANITNSRFIDNNAAYFGGGLSLAIQSNTIANISNSTIAGNTANTTGGGLDLINDSGATTIIAGSTFSDNMAGVDGGGIRINNSGALSVTRITNCTISENRANDDGGGAFINSAAGATSSIFHSTITGNDSDNDASTAGSGGGLYLTGPGNFVLDHTIVAANFDNSATVANDIDATSFAPGTFSANFNLIGDNTGSGLAAGNPDGDGNRIGTGAAPINPLLGFLHPNGGPTDTHKLLPGSPAIDAGNPAFAPPPANDQRGVPFIRVFDGAAPAGAVIDIGAYELQNLGVPQVLVVDILTDENDGDYSPGDLSLREAIGLANGNVGIAETITFAAGLNGGTILLTLGQLVINDALTINASALAAGITIDASGNDPTPGTDDGMGTRVFEINDSTNGRINVTLNHLTISGGDNASAGGGIRSFENLTVVDSTITGNHAESTGGGIESNAASLTLLRTTISQNSSYAGGGIYFASLDADLTITNSFIPNNVAENRGGGIAVEEADEVTINSSTVSGNTSGTRGGGIYLIDSIASSIVNSTFSGNRADGEGGGIFNITQTGNATTIAHSTITRNTADQDNDGSGSGGGILAVIRGTFTLTHTIVAENTDRSGTAPDIDQTTEPGGTFNHTFSLIGNNLGSGLAAGNPDGNGNRIGTNAAPLDPGLAALNVNGGPTPTHALEPGSLAIDNGSPAAVAGAGGIPSFDQRGNPFTRVFDGNGVGGPRIDIGAFEVNAFQLVLPDDFEPNDTLQTATILGSPPFETIRNLSITAGNGDNIANDIDYFKYTAHYTGKLAVRIHFRDDFGNLDLEVRDMFDNVIASSTGTTDIEEIIIPVVFQEMYFIRVFGFTPFGEDIADANNYTLEVENFPAPVPTGVVLDPASDTGMMDNDNVTSDDTPTIFIQTDVLNFVDTNNNGLFDDPDTAPVGTADDIDALSPTEANNILNHTPTPFDQSGGIAVEVTFVNTTNGTFVTGFAEAVIGTVPDVYRFTPSAPLTPGVYLVTARTRVFDGQSNAAGMPDQKTNRSNASPPLRLVIDTVGAPAGSVTADMLKSSDTGMFNDDNVTNKMSPAFQGIAPVGSKVRLFANGELVGQTVAGSDTSDVGHAVGGIGGLANDGLGLWEITTEPLADDAYDITLEVEDAAGNVTKFDPRFNGPDQRFDIVIDTLEPNTPYLDLLDDTGRHDNDNITKINKPLVSMTTTDPNFALAQLLFTDNLKFRIYDRFQSTAGTPAPEVLIYDSAQDPAADAVTTAGDMFTSLTQLTKLLPFLTPASPAITAAGNLADGVHNLKLEVEDRAGNISHDFLLEITVDTVTPPVSFGLPDAVNNTDGLTASSDSGVTTVPNTYADRVTNDTTPTLWGRAEADTIVRLYLDVNADGVIDLNTDIFLGQTTAIPLDGNVAYPNGYWEITSALDLNQLVGFPKDGLRRLLVTAEDVAGNPMPMFVDEQPVISDGVAALQIFIDTQGPQIVDVNLGPDIDYDLFDPKPSTNGPTPLVHSLFIDVRDLPRRLDQTGTLNDFLYDALVEDIAETIGNYDLVGDYVGQVIIQQVIVHFESVVGGQPAFASIELVFAEPLPDDRYTLTVRDNLVDPAGNRLDGESGNADPFEDPNFPSGDGVPGGNFVARFTVDSRPEIGVWAAGIVHIDTNGNFHFDPENVDFTNRDLIYTLGFSSDYIFAGNFAPIGGVADGFDKLAVYGRVGNQWRFLIDFDNDGVPDQEFLAPAINGIPVAGNFDGNLANGDEIGIFTGSAWYFDTNHDFVVDDGFATDYAGFPVAGDFDGDGDDDVGTYIASQAGGNFFHIDINTAGLGSSININGSADYRFRVGIPGLGTFGFAGVRERPVAADMNADGVDDLGLWVPDGTAILPGDQGEWFFLLSDVERVRDGEEVSAFGGGGIIGQTVIDRIIGGGVVDFVPFSTTPFGQDLYARFGNSFALPIVGNFDPPHTSGSASTQRVVYAANATTTPTIPALHRAGSSPGLNSSNTSHPTTPSTTTTVQPPPAPAAPPVTSSTTTNTVKVVASAATAAATKTVTKATAKSTAKVAKKIAVPVVEAKAKATKTTAPATTAKSVTKAVTPVVVPKAKTSAKAAKVATTTAKKTSTAAATSKPAAAKKVATPKASLVEATKKSTTKTKAVTTNVGLYTGTTVVNVGILTVSNSTFAPLPGLVINLTPTGEVVPQTLPSTYTVTQTAPLVEPLVLTLAQEIKLIDPVPAIGTPAVVESGVLTSSGPYFNPGSVQDSTISGTLEISAGYASGPAVLHLADILAWQQALADAAVADLHMTLADVTTDADAIAADGHSSDGDALELALAADWESVLPANW